MRGALVPTRRRPAVGGLGSGVLIGETGSSPNANFPHFCFSGNETFFLPRLLKLFS